MTDELKHNCPLCEKTISKFTKFDENDPNITIEELVREKYRQNLIVKLNQLHESGL